MSNKFERVVKVNNRVDKLSQEELFDNFEKIKILLKENKSVANNPLLKSITFFVDKNIILDVDVFWVDSYIQICDSKDNIKKDGYYFLLINIFKRSMIDALRKDKTIDQKTKYNILKRFAFCGIESVLEENEEIEEDISDAIDNRNERVVNYQDFEEELYQ